MLSPYFDRAPLGIVSSKQDRVERPARARARAPGTRRDPVR